MRKKNWLEKTAFSKSGVRYTWGYVIFLLVPSLIALMAIVIMIFVKTSRK